MAEDVVAAGANRGSTLAPGRMIGPYRIERQIGRGGMSIVYAATHLPLDRVVALKVLLPSLAGDTEFVQRFLSEARSAARLDYPHIVPVYDSGEVGSVNFIAMKLLEGRDLKSVLQERRGSASKGGLPLNRVISIASQAAGALEYAHQHRVVHRDIKPANIYVDDNDRVTLVDFGIARALDMASSTLTGAVLGTPAYMSPEQARGQPADYRSDIYSLGVVIYEMLAGAPPFAGDPRAVMHAHVYSDIPPLTGIRGDIPRGVDDVVRRALDKDPNARYQNAGALALALTNAAGGQLSKQALAGDDGEATISMPSANAASTGTPFTGSVGRPLTGSLPASQMISSVTGEAEPQATTAPPLPAAPSARSRLLPAVGLVLALAVVAAVVVWAVLAGPLAPQDGRLVVNSDPPGATVTVDGNRLGVTPLAGQKLPAGPHELLLDKTGFIQVKRTERVRARQTDTVSAGLTPLSAADMLSVKQAIVARDITQANGAITIGAPTTSVHVDEQFGLVVTLVPASPGTEDVSFRYEIALIDPSGNRLTGSPPAQATINKDDTAGQSFAFTFTFHKNSDGTVSVGTYQLEFLVDNQAVTKRPITLAQ